MIITWKIEKLTRDLSDGFIKYADKWLSRSSRAICGSTRDIGQIEGRLR